jgi:hypothetical protein
MTYRLIATALLAASTAAAANTLPGASDSMDSVDTLGRRAAPAPVVGVREAVEFGRYRVHVELGERAALRSVHTRETLGALPDRLAQVIEEAIGVGAAIQPLKTDARGAAPGHFEALLDTRALNWLRAHPEVAAIELVAAGDAALSDSEIGGREPLSAENRGWTETRILQNGSIIGWGVTGYEQPYVSTGGNLFGDAAEILRAHEYSVSFNGTTLTATRGGNNGFGVFRITLTNGSRNLVLATNTGQTTTLTLPEAATVRNGKLMAPARLLLERGARSAILDWDADTRTLQTYYYERLDTGIYFLGIQQNAIRTDQPGAQKYIPGQPNPFFNPARPTIIYAHGWNKGSVSARNREGLLFTQDNQWQNVQNYWISRGWNVGIFQWTQLADDDWGAQPVDTEKKIYDANSTGVGMRWRNSSNVHITAAGRVPTTNVTQIYRAAYLQVASALNSGVEIRLIGNSLGGNLSLAMTRELIINGSRRPSRLTLHDPYWDGSLDSSDGVTIPNGLGSNRGVARDAAQRVFNSGMAMEYFRSSAAGALGYDGRVALLSSYVNFVPGYTGDQAIKHTQATRQYLWAVDFAGTVASPNTPATTVRARMNTRDFWDHVGGTATATPGDDSFLTRNNKPE